MVEASYEIAGQAVIGAFREERYVQAIYVRRSLATGDWCPGLSDLDIAIVLDNSAMSGDVDLLVSLSRRYVDIGTRFRFLGEVEFYTPSQLIEGRETGYDTYRRYEAKNTWRQIHGRGKGYLQELATPRRQDLQRGIVFETLVWWRYLNSLLFTPDQDYDQRWEGYQLYKFTSDIARLSLHVLDPNTPLMFSRHQAVNHLKHRHQPIQTEPRHEETDASDFPIHETASYLAQLRENSYIDNQLETRKQDCYKACYQLVDQVMNSTRPLFQPRSSSTYRYPSHRAVPLEEADTRRIATRMDRSLYTPATCRSVLTATSPFNDHELYTILIPRQRFWDTDWYTQTSNRLRETLPRDTGTLRRHSFEILPASSLNLIGSLWLHNETTRLHRPSRNIIHSQGDTPNTTNTITPDMMANLDNYQEHILNRTRTLYSRAEGNTANFLKAFWEIATYHALQTQNQENRKDRKDRKDQKEQKEKTRKNQGREGKGDIDGQSHRTIVPTTTREITDLYSTEPGLKNLRPSVKKITELYLEGLRARETNTGEIKKTALKTAATIMRR